MRKSWKDEGKALLGRVRGLVIVDTETAEVKLYQPETPSCFQEE